VASVTPVLNDSSVNWFTIFTDYDNSFPLYETDHELLYPEDKAENWPIDDITPQLTSSSSSPEQETEKEEQICYGTVLERLSYDHTSC
jgi:hypothetical protein